MADPRPWLAAVRAADPSFGALAARHPRRWAPLDTPFLDATTIARLDVLTADRPRWAHFALVGDGAIRLTGDPQAFDRCVAADPGRLCSADDALALVTARVESTRPLTARARVVRTPRDMPWMPSMAPDDVELRARIERRIAATPPMVSATAHGYAVDGWLLDDRDLVWTRFHVDARGAVRAEHGERLVGLPLTYVL